MTSESKLDQDLNLSLTEMQSFLKKLSKDIKTGSWRGCQKTALIQPLVSMYFENGDKDLKKLIPSVLQSFPREDEQKIVTSISSSIENLLQSKTSRIEKLSTLLINFPIGEKAIMKSLNGVLELCKQNLKELDSELREVSRSLTEKDKIMSEVLFTIQFVNKVLGKYFEEDGGDDNGDSKHVCHELFGFFAKVMSEELYYMDCLIASSIGITLLLKNFCRGDEENMKTIPFIILDNGTSICIRIIDFMSKHLRGINELPVSSKICFINAFLSIIPINNLSASSSSSSFLVCSGGDDDASILALFVEELLGFDTRSMSSNCKLIHSRTIATFSTKLKHHIEGCSVNHDDLLNLLSGQSDTFRHLVDHLLHHLNDPTDVVRHQSKVSLDNIVFCHTRLEHPGQANDRSNFLHALVEKHLKDFDCSTSGKYSSLVCLVRHVGADVFLSVQPALIESLLAALNDQSMACHVTSFFEELWSSSYDGSAKKSKDDESMRGWFDAWVAPVLRLLHLGSVNQRSCIAQFLLPKLFVKNEECLDYMISQLVRDDKDDGMNPEQVSALISCLKHVMQKKNNGKSFKLSAKKLEEILSKVVVHQDEQLRLDGFSMLCEHHKTTEVVAANHLRLVLEFVEFNLDNQSPSFRQRFTTVVKKLFTRMSESGRFVERKHSSECKKANPNNNEMAALIDILDNYKSFLSRLSDLCFRSLHLGSSFPSRTSSLSILILLNQFFPPPPVGSMQFDFRSIISPPSMFLLISILGDSFERNKQDALELLTGLNVDVVSLNESFDVSKLFKIALKLSESVRPQDCVTASHLIKFLLHSLTLDDIVTFIQARSNKKTIENVSINHVDDDDVISDRDEIRNEKCLVIISWLLDRLQHHKEVASSNLLLASATSPMYPIIHCISKVMAVVDWNGIKRVDAWKRLLERLIQTCIDVADIVSVVVNDSSPEGNVPDDLGTNCDLDVCVDFTDAEPFLKCDEEEEDGDDDDDDDEEKDDDDDPQKSQNAESKVRMMPEFLVVCCWRSIKETSLILGQISSSIPIRGGDDDRKGLLSLDMVDKVGNFFKEQLLNSRHRGAFELAYAGFVQLVRTMWSSALSDLQTLPQIWVEHLIERVKVHDNDGLCSTRRSAGVPFFFLAVTSTEPIANDGRCLKYIMKHLIGTASEPITSDHTHHIHSRNILRVLFRDSSLGDQVHSFVSDGIKVCIEGYNCTYWPVSNSSAMLFSILIRRIFGIRKTKAESKSRNLGMSGRAFFTRHPELFEYFLQQLSDDDDGDNSIRRGTFMILITLSNLSPSAGENSKSSINVDSLVPRVLKCSNSRDIHIREMAAKALSSLVQKEQTIKVVLDIFKSLNENVESGMCNHNYIHGSCLQIHHLMDSSDFDYQIVNDIDSMHAIIDEAHKLNVLLSERNPCLVTRYSFGLIVERLLSLPMADESFEKWRNICLAIFKTNLKHVIRNEIPSKFPDDDLGESLNHMTLEDHHRMKRSLIQYHPYFNQYATFLARINLLFCDRADEFGRLCKMFLESNIQDVQLETLRMVRRLIRHCSDNVADDVKLSNDDDDDESISQSKGSRFKTQEGIFSSRNVAEFISVAVKSVVDFILVDDIIYLNLVQAMSCLIEALKLKSCIDLKVLNFEETTKLFKRSLELTSESSFVEVQEEALYLSSHCCHVVFNHSASSLVTDKHFDLLVKFCNIINARVLSETSNSNLKLASSFALAFNHHALLVDAPKRLGCLVYRNWTSLIHLSQDEEVKVREMTASCIIHLQHVLDGSNYLTGVNPTFGTKILLEIFFHLHCCDQSSHWSSRGLQTFYDWMVYDPIEHQDQQDVRLFDRGELNPYMDNTKLILTIRDTFIQRLRQTCGKDSRLKNFQGERTCSEVQHRDQSTACHSCEESDKWNDSNGLQTWMKHLEREKEALEIRLKESSSIEIFAKQSTLQRLITNYLRKSSALAVADAFLGRSDAKNDSSNNKTTATMFNHAKYLVS